MKWYSPDVHLTNVPLGPQGGYNSVQIDFEGKNPQTAQIEEILEQTMLNRVGAPWGMPVYIAKGVTWPTQVKHLTTVGSFTQK